MSEMIVELQPQLQAGTVLLAFIFFDIVVGLAKAIMTHSYSSSTMREGLAHKIGELLGYIFGILCDISLPQLGIVLPVHLATAVCTYITIMEVGSIIENFGIMNPELGKYLHKIFAKVPDPVEDADFIEVEDKKENDDS